MGSMADGHYRLRFLHISDLHVRGAHDKEPWRTRRVLGRAWIRNLETLVLEEGPLDFVFFTGDAANRGKAEEYGEVTDFFQALREEIGLAADRVFVIPGNHDIDRSVREDAWRAMRMQLAATHDLLAVSRWMNGIGGPPPGFKDDWAPGILTRQKAYRQWVSEGLGRPELAPAGLGYRVTVNLPGWAVPVHVFGLDTSWLCGDEADAGKLLLTENQLMRHATDSKGSPLPGLRIALMHHPFHELGDGPACRRLVREGTADLVLRGHLHQPEATEQKGELAAGCLYEGERADKYPNSCNFVRMELDSGGRPIEATVRFRTFSITAGHWYDDSSLYPEAKAGRMRWEFGAKPAHAKPNPYSPWTPRAEHCFGRTEILRRLERALEEERSMWLVGDWRIGKTLILMAWEKRLKERGRVVKLVSGQGPAGVSAGRFVEAVTGLDSPAGADGAADRLTAWLESVSPAGLPPVILVDEVESVVETCEVRFFDRLRDLIGRVCLVFSSREAPDQVFLKYNKVSPIGNRMEPAWIGLLEPDGAESVIRLGAEDLGPGDADLMRKWAGCHAFYLQLLGRQLVEARRAGASASEALDQFKAEFGVHVRKLLATPKLTGPQMQMLRDSAMGMPCRAGVFVQRGLVTEEGWPFCEAFAAWLRGEIV